MKQYDENTQKLLDDLKNILIEQETNHKETLTLEESNFKNELIEHQKMNIQRTKNLIMHLEKTFELN